MRATVIYGAGDVRVESVPDPAIAEPSDAVVRVLRACICGSDLWPYRSLPKSGQASRIGHEFLGVVEETGSDVTGLSPGDVVLAPFMFEDNTCEFCIQGLQSSCRHGGLWGSDGVDGGQGEAVRVPQAQGTLVKLPVGQDSALLPSLLTLSDVFPTGHHAAVTAGVGPGAQATVIGDGAVGVLAVLAASRLGAERIILMGRHPERTSLGRAFGATDVVAERGQQGVDMVRELTDGDGTAAVLECVGLRPSIEMAFGVVRDGGVISRIGAPQYDEVPTRSFQHEMEAREVTEEARRSGEQIPADPSIWTRNITLTGGMTPARAYIDELLPDVLNGKVEPGRVLDRTVDLSAVPDGYRAMADREALKVMVVP